MKLNDVLHGARAGGDSGNCRERAAMPASSPLNLDAFGVAQGCFAGAPDDITERHGDRRRASRRVGLSATTRSPARITWLGTQPKNPWVEFDWSNDGICGEAPGNSSARCIVIEWIGAVSAARTPEAARTSAHRPFGCATETSRFVPRGTPDH